MKNLLKSVLVLVSFVGINFANVRFLEEYTSPRQTSLGGAYCGVVDDVSGVMVNPAVLNYVVYPELSFMYRKGLMDSYYNFVGFVYPMKRGSIGITGLMFDGGDIEVNYLDGENKKIKLEQDTVVSLGYGNNSGEIFFHGINLKFINSQLAEQYKPITIASDLGLLIRSIDNKISFGLSIENLGLGLKYKDVTEELPTNLKLGLAFRLIDDRELSLLFAADMKKSIKDNETADLYNFGLETQLYKIAYLRIGYKTPSPNTISLGFGFNIYSLCLDYAYLPLSSIDEMSHYISLSLKFGSMKIYDISDRYYKKGMKKRAYVLWKQLEPKDSGYFVAQQKIEKVSKEIAEEYIQKGKEFLDSSNWSSAMKEFEKALSYDPKNQDALQLFVQAKINKENEEKKLLIEKYLRKAQWATKLGNWDDAIKLYQQVLELEPTNTEAQKQVVSVLISKAKHATEDKNWNDAIKLWKQVLELDPTNTEAQKQLTLARISKKKEMYDNKLVFSPSIRSFNPTRAPIGTEIEIIGDNFDLDEEANEVLFDNVPAKVIKAEKDRLLVRIPNISKIGPVQVEVRTYGGSSAPKLFYVVPPGKPPLLKITNLTFIDTNGDKILSAEEKGKIVFDIENTSGAGKGYGVVVNVSSSKDIDIKFDKEIEIGDIEPGQKKSVEINVSAGMDVPTGDVVLNLKVDEATGFGAEPKQIVFKTEEIKSPKLEIAKIEIDDKFYPDRQDKLSVGNGDGIIQPGESVEVMLTVVNKGLGNTKNSSARIISYSRDVTFRSNIADLELGDIKPGECREIKFVFSIPKTYTGSDVLKFNLKILDERERFSTEIPFELTLGKIYEKIEVVKIEGKQTEMKPVVIPTFGDELLTLPAVQPVVSQDAVGVIIGIKNYKHKDVPEVEYALKDASLVKEYFINVLGIPKENIIYIENPTQSDFIRVFGTRDDYKGELYNYIKPNKSEVFIYYTGHGAPDVETKTAYFVPSDCHPNYVKLNGYSLDLFYENLSKLPAKSVNVIIDACFSGGSEKGMLIAKASPLMVVPIADKFVENINIFTSSSGDEISSWYPEKNHSLFTYFFLRALQGEADKNKDKSLNFAEIEDYVKENVSFLARKMYGRKQTPKFIGNRDKVIVRYK